MSPQAEVCKIAALLLAYPDEGWQRRLPLVGEALARLPPSRAARELERFVAAVRARRPDDLAAEYVETFDFAGATSLNLTAVLFGEERERAAAPQRGFALVQLGEVYAAHGYTVANGELPDHLPVLLEFMAAAGCPPQLADRAGVLGQAISRLAQRLDEAGSVYAPALRAAQAAFDDLCRGRRAS